MATLKEIARTIFDHALAECSIERSFDRTLQITAGPEGTRLIIGGRDEIALDRLTRVRIVAAGKAAAAMLTSLFSRLPLPATCDLQGVLIAGERPPNLPATIQFFPGGHPTPNEASFAGASAALSMLRALHDASPDDTLCLFLISGGASAMMELPLDPTISLADTVAFHKALVHSGASIVEINCVRKHFSAVKGGRLALAAGNARKISLLVSDVPATHLDALASGPAIADPTTIADCREILARYQLLDRFPVSVRRYFQSPDLAESPKPGAFVSRSWKLLDSDELTAIAQNYAATLGFHTVLDNTCRRLDLRRCSRLSAQSPPRTPPRAPARLPYLCRRSHRARSRLTPPYFSTRGRPQSTPRPLSRHPTPPRRRPHRDHLRRLRRHRRQQPRGRRCRRRSHTLKGRSALATAKQALKAFDSSNWLSRAGATIVTGPTGHNLRDLRILLADEATS